MARRILTVVFPAVLMPDLSGVACQSICSSSVWFWRSSVIQIHCTRVLAHIEPFLVKLYCGQKKQQSLDDFLKEFVADLQTISVPKCVMLNGLHHTVAIHCCFVHDVPWTFFIKNTKNHTWIPWVRQVHTRKRITLTTEWQFLAWMHFFKQTKILNF